MHREMKKVLTYFTILLLPFLVISRFVMAEEQKTKVTSNFSQNWLKSIISIEIIEKNKQNNTEKHISIGTGFLILSKNKHLILMTAKHVILDKKTGSIKNNLAYRLNDKEGDSLLVREEELGRLNIGSWFLSGDRDLACRFIYFAKTSDLVAISKDSFLIEQESIKAGTPILMLGFPLGLRSEKYALPITRSGVMARVDSDNFIVDVNFYPGNSGGPIIYVPALKLGRGLNSNLINEEKLLGLAVEYISYIDTAFSLQTERPRVTFEENSGLCIALPATLIFSFLEREDIVKLDEQLNKITEEKVKNQ